MAWDLHHCAALVKAVKSLAPSNVKGHGKVPYQKRTSAKVYGTWYTPETSAKVYGAWHTPAYSRMC